MKTKRKVFTETLGFILNLDLNKLICFAISTFDNMTINEEVPHFVTSRREVLLALEETEIEAIVYALEVYFLENRPVDPTKNSENDSVAGRFDSLKDKVIARNDNLPGIERSFCIGCITRHVIKPLKELKKEDMSEETRNKLDERINFYWNLVLKLKFGKK